MEFCVGDYIVATFRENSPNVRQLVHTNHSARNEFTAELVITAVDDTSTTAPLVPTITAILFSHSVVYKNIRYDQYQQICIEIADIETADRYEFVIDDKFKTGEFLHGEQAEKCVAKKRDETGMLVIQRPLSEIVSPLIPNEATERNTISETTVNNQSDNNMHMHVIAENLGDRFFDAIMDDMCDDEEPNHCELLDEYNQTFLHALFDPVTDRHSESGMYFDSSTTKYCAEAHNPDLATTM